MGQLMVAQTKYDPFALLPFLGFIDAETGRQEQHYSLAHFYLMEQARGVDASYRHYLSQLSDPEIFRMEAGCFPRTVGEGQRPEWDVFKHQLLYAGIYMQAVNNRSFYAELLKAPESLVISDSAFSTEVASAMGRFIDSLNSQENQLRVAFIGTTDQGSYAQDCFEAIFAKNRPLCLFAIEGDGCATEVSAYAQRTGSALVLIEPGQGEAVIAEDIQRRCSHVFKFLGLGDSDVCGRVTPLLEQSGVQLRQLQQKT